MAANSTGKEKTGGKLKVIVLSLALAVTLSFTLGRSLFTKIAVMIQGEPFKLLDFLYRKIGYPYSEIFGLAASLFAAWLAFLLVQALTDRGLLQKQTAGKAFFLGVWLWVFVAFRWITKMPVAIACAIGFLIFLGIEKRKKTLALLLDPEIDLRSEALRVFATLLLLNAFFWWPGKQFLVALAVTGMVIGRLVAAKVRKKRGGSRLKFAKSKTLESFVAMFVATALANLLILHMGMIQFAGVNKPIFYTLIIALGALLSSAAWIFSPAGWESFLIGICTAFPIYFYTN